MLRLVVTSADCPMLAVVALVGWWVGCCLVRWVVGTADRAGSPQLYTRPQCCNVFIENLNTVDSNATISY